MKYSLSSSNLSSSFLKHESGIFWMSKTEETKFTDIQSAKVTCEKHGNKEDYYVEINSLEQLMAFIEEVDNRVVIDKNSITIYDGYLE